MPKKMTDRIISADALKTIHDTVEQQGNDAMLHHIAERESALTAYVLCSAFQISNYLRDAGVGSSVVDWVSDEVTARLLVAVEAQYLAQRELWREFLPDEE